MYGRGRLEVFNQAENEWGTVNGNLGRFDFAAANVACRAMGYNCVMDWGLAKDWGLELDEEEAKEMSIGYWGHSCDGDEPGLQYCCNAPRRWIGDRFRTMSSFSRKSIITSYRYCFKAQLKYYYAILLISAQIKNPIR